MTGDAMREVREAVGIATRSAADADFAARCRSSYGAGPGDLARADRALVAITAAPAEARLALARAITPPDHAVVPVEATRAMLEAAAAKDNEAYRLGSQHGADDEQIYDAMIAAARGADAEGGKDA
jgi:hypothetical protein